MKKNLLLILTLLSVAFVGCQTDPATESAWGGDGVSELTISVPSTRTHLGEKVGETYPLYWSEGDKIAVNGVESAEAVINPNEIGRAHV